MRYYKIQVQLGHLGCGNELPAWVYIRAKNMTAALTIARKIPAVKHNRIPLWLLVFVRTDFSPRP